MVGGMVTDTASSQVAVKPAATASYKWQDVCIGNKTLFDNQTQDNNTIIKSYAWNFGDPTTLTDTTSAKNAEYKYDLNGEYEVKLVVTNTLGCTDTIINKVNIFKGPAANFIWNNNCASRPVNFTDQSQATSSAIVNWNWQFSNNGEVLDKSTQQNCTYNFVHAGTYDADMKVIDKNGCATTINKQVTISPNPVAAFTIVENYDNIQGQVMLSNGTIDGTNNYWDFGNGVTSYGSNPVVTFTDEGHYNIQLLTWNDQNCTDTISMSYDLMYKGLFVPNAFNPGHKNSEVALFKPKGLNLKTYQLEVYDSWGNLLWKSDKLDDGGSPLEGWDGTYQGALLQQDVYVWKILAQYKDDQIWDGLNIGDNKNMPLTKSGTVTLLR
jgi:PKD repeat protein